MKKIFLLLITFFPILIFGQTPTWQQTLNSSSTANISKNVILNTTGTMSLSATGGISFLTGFKISGTAPSGKFLTGNGTNYIESTSTIPTSAGATANKHLISDGTNYILSTPTFPNTATGTGTILRADGTNWLATTNTFPNTTGTGQILHATSTNVIGGNSNFVFDGTNLHIAEASAPNANANLTVAGGVRIGSDLTGWGTSGIGSLAILNSIGNSRIDFGQSPTASGTLIWSYNANPALASLQLGNGNGNPLIIQPIGGGKVGIQVASPTAVLHLPAGTATANTAPLKINPGTNLTTPERGSLEYDGVNYFVTDSTATRYTIAKVLTGSSSLNFPSTLTGAFSDLTITVTGANFYDPVILGANHNNRGFDTYYTAWVSAANTVTVRFTNNSASTDDPVQETVKVSVVKF